MSIFTGMLGFLRRRVEGLQRRIWPLNARRVAVLVVLLFVVMFVAFEARSTEIISVEVVIVPEEARVGFNPTDERLDFGDMSRGSTQTRHLILENNGMIPTRVSLLVLGDVGDYIGISDAFFTLDPDESVTVDLTLAVPDSASEGKHSGKLVVFRMPWGP